MLFISKLMSSTSLSGGNLVDGLPPVASFDSACGRLLHCMAMFILVCPKPQGYI